MTLCALALLNWKLIYEKPHPDRIDRTCHPTRAVKCPGYLNFIPFGGLLALVALCSRLCDIQYSVAAMQRFPA